MPVFFSQTTVRAPAPWTWAAVACVAAVAAAGCSRSEKGRLVAEPEAPAAQATTAEARQSAQPETAFEPPPLEALDRDAKWIDRPVKDALAVRTCRKQLSALLRGYSNGASYLSV